MNTITPRTETEALLHEKFQALAAETLEKKFQDRVNAAEQTDEAKQCPHCKKNGSPQNENENADNKQQSHQDFTSAIWLRRCPMKFHASWRTTLLFAKRFKRRKAIPNSPPTARSFISVKGCIKNLSGITVACGV
jgi:hypothetical protein